MTEASRQEVLLVTGGASGIGAATARIWARKGVAIAINYRTREEEAARLVEALRAQGAKAIAVRADVARPAEVEALFGTVDRELGRVTALVNSAGIAPGPKLVTDVDTGELERLMLTNVVGLMTTCREAVKRMSTERGGQGGVIVNVSSMAATIGGRPGNSHYAASKAAVDVFTVGLAKEVAGQGIRAISVRPGFTVTDMTRDRLSDPEFVATLEASIPLGRPAQVEEVARPITWLLSEEASFITGTCLDVSGGGFHIAKGRR